MKVNSVPPFLSGSLPGGRSERRSEKAVPLAKRHIDPTGAVHSTIPTPMVPERTLLALLTT